MSSTAPDVARHGAPDRTHPSSRRAMEHRFFTTYLVALILVIFLGFAPTFYLRGIMPPYAPLRPLRPEVIAHGVLAAAFLLAFPLQAWLIATNRRALHILVGNWAFALGVAMLPLGYVIALTNYHSLAGAPLPPPLVPATISSAPLLDVVALATLLWIGWQRRHEAQVHKRLMVMMACGLSDPGISRLPLGLGDGIAGVLLSSALVFATTLPLWGWDLATRRRLHWATVLGSALLGGKLVLRLLIGTTPGWIAFVAMLPGFGAP